MSAADLSRDLLRAVQALRAAQVELERCSRTFAQAERNYRRGSAIALIRAEGRTVDERKADAEQLALGGENPTTVNELRYERDLAEGLKVSALEAVRSERGIVSALQTLVALERSEAELAKWSPSEVA